MNAEVIRASEMALDDVIDKLPDDEVIHIGSDTGFFFADCKAEFYRDVDQIEKNYLQTAHKRLKENLNRIQNLTKEFRKKKVNFAEAKEIVKKIGDANERAQCNEKYLSEFETILGRKVIDIYDRIQKDGICIIVTGSENGKYWFREEYENKE